MPASLACRFTLPPSAALLLPSAVLCRLTLPLPSITTLCSSLCRPLCLLAKLTLPTSAITLSPLVTHSSLNSFIDLEDTLDPSLTASDEEASGNGARLSFGFRLHLYKWCRDQRRGLPLPTLQGHAWADALPDGVRFRDQLRVRHVLGLEWRTGWHAVTSPGWFAVEAIDVVIHFSVLCLVPAAFAYYALDAQRSWAKLLCVPATTDSLLAPAAAASVDVSGFSVPSTGNLAYAVSDCAVWSDLNLRFGPKVNLYGGGNPLPLVYFIVSDAMTLLVTSLFRLLLCYLNPERMAGWKLVAHMVATQVFGLMLLLNCLAGFSAVGMVLAWHVLGGATRPVAFLPNYAIVLAVALIMQSVGSSMFRGQHAVREGLHARFLRMLQPHLQSAYHRSQFQLSLQRSAAVGKHLALPEAAAVSVTAETAAEAEAAERTALMTGGAAVLVPTSEYMSGRLADESSAGGANYDRTLQPVDIYLILAGDGRKPLLVEDFRPRFETLGLPLTTRQKEVLFSQVEMARVSDAEGRSEGLRPMVTARQFCEAWEAMEQGLLRRGVQLAGVSSAQIAMTVALCLLALGVFLVFLAVGFDALGNSSNAAFASVVRAVLVLTCAGFVAVARPRSRAEKDAAAVVHEVINDDLARAAEA